MSIQSIKIEASYLAAALYYVDEPSCLCSAYRVVSAANGNALGVHRNHTCPRAAYRLGIRFAVQRMRLARQAAGMAAAHAAILAMPPTPFAARQAAEWRRAAGI